MNIEERISISLVDSHQGKSNLHIRSFVVVGAPIVCFREIVAFLVSVGFLIKPLPLSVKPEKASEGVEA